MFSALNANDRMAAIAAVIVVITGVISVANQWGVLMFVPILAGAGVLFIVFQARVAPAAKLPMTRGTLLLGLGAIAALIWAAVTLQYLGYILTPPILIFDSIQFIVGLVAAIVMAFAGWRAYQSEKGAAPAAPSPEPPAAPPAPPPA
jgi:glucan phosphoethanolaminetransferase (alkaline phosphatase superfamily)